MKLYLKTYLAIALCGGLGSLVAQDAPKQPKLKKEAAAPELFTVVYNVPPTLLSFPIENDSGPAEAADPFAEPVRSSDSNSSIKTVQKILEFVGVTFPKGASAIFNPSNSSLIVRNTRDQLDLIEVFLENIVEDSEKQILVIFEMIEVDHLDFSDWFLSNTMDHDGTELRKAAQEWVREGRGTILSTTTVMARSGQRAKNESISEHIYPTEFDPPEIPNEVTLSDRAEAPITGVTPTAFETRNLGVTIEVDPVIGADGVTIDLNLAPERVELEGHTIWSSEDADEMFQTRLPTFYAMKITTQVTLHTGRYCLLGSTKPLAPATAGLDNVVVLNFVRADVGRVADWSVEEAKE